MPVGYAFDIARRQGGLTWEGGLPARRRCAARRCTWSGVPLRAFLERVGADLRAKCVAFKTADDCPSSIDMAAALQPQTLLAMESCRGDPGRPVRLPAAAADVPQARVQ